MLWNSPKVITTSKTESIYTLILSIWNPQLEDCVSVSNLLTIILKIYPGNRNANICHFLYVDATKNGMLQLYQ